MSENITFRSIKMNNINKTLEPIDLKLTCSLELIFEQVTTIGGKAISQGCCPVIIGDRT